MTQYGIYFRIQIEKFKSKNTNILIFKTRRQFGIFIIFLKILIADIIL